MIIQVTYESEVPDDMTNEEIQAYLEYTLTERGTLPESNPMQGCGPEPHEETIRFVILNKQ